MFLHKQRWNPVSMAPGLRTKGPKGVTGQLPPSLFNDKEASLTLPTWQRPETKLAGALLGELVVLMHPCLSEKCILDILKYALVSWEKRALMTPRHGGKNILLYLIFKKMRTWWARCIGAVVKVLALHAQDPKWAPVLIPAAPLPFQLPACGPGKQSRAAQGFGTLHQHGRPGRGSWLQIGIASAVALTWGVNHRMEDLPLCLSSLYIRLSNEKIIKINL